MADPGQIRACLIYRLVSGLLKSGKKIGFAVTAHLDFCAVHHLDHSAVALLITDHVAKAYNSTLVHAEEAVRMQKVFVVPKALACRDAFPVKQDEMGIIPIAFQAQNVMD